MTTRKADARWTGDLKTGTGLIRLGSGAFEGPYSFKTRFLDTPGANPEELLGAAHAGCFAMALNNMMFLAGHAPRSVFATADVRMDNAGAGTSIVEITLTVEAEVPGITAEQFQAFAEDAKTNCIISRALSVPIVLRATLR